MPASQEPGDAQTTTDGRPRDVVGPFQEGMDVVVPMTAMGYAPGLCTEEEMAAKHQTADTILLDHHKDNVPSLVAVCQEPPDRSDGADGLEVLVVGHDQVCRSA